MKSTHQIRAAVALALIAGLAACGGDDDEPAAAAPEPTEEAAPEPTEEAAPEPTEEVSEPTEEEAPPPTTAAGAEQQVQETTGDGCTYDQYAGGVEQVDLATAKIGFAQSEREANPFRIAETQSIRDEAAARGIELIVTNAESDLN
jgi:outer membrane biosynthesis protein TonB